MIYSNSNPITQADMAATTPVKRVSNPDLRKLVYVNLDFIIPNNKQKNAERQLLAINTSSTSLLFVPYAIT